MRVPAASSSLSFQYSFLSLFHFHTLSRLACFPSTFAHLSVESHPTNTLSFPQPFSYGIHFYSLLVNPNRLTSLGELSSVICVIGVAVWTRDRHGLTRIAVSSTLRSHHNAFSFHLYTLYQYCIISAHIIFFIHFLAVFTFHFILFYLWYLLYISVIYIL